MAKGIHRRTIYTKEKMKIILDEQWMKSMVSECAEAMTLHLLNATNPENNNDDCGCLTCLAHICVEAVLDRIHEEGNELMEQQKLNQKIDRRNIN